MTWVILVRDSSGGLRVKRGLSQEALSIGRSSINDIVLDAPGVSRRHARIVVREGQPWFEDLGGVNGSFIAGQRVRGAIPWSDQRILIVGFTFDVEPDPEGRGLPHFHVQDRSEPVTRPWDVAETFHWRSPAAVFDQQLQALRDKRLLQRDEAEKRRVRLDHDWQHLLRSANELRDRLRGAPQLLGFTISEDAREVAIRLADPSAASGISFVLTRRHPEQLAGDRDGGVWLRQSGAEDVMFREPPDALAELMRRLAARVG